MKTLCTLVSAVLAFAGSAMASVTVSSPASGSTVTSPVQYIASASNGTCTKGVAAIGIYVSGQLVYKVNGNSLNTAVTLNPGTYSTTVQAWDNCGGVSKTSVPITVKAPGSTQNGVTVMSPANGSTVSSPVSFVATSGTTSCAKGIASMGIYVGGVLQYKVSGSSMNTTLALPAGAQKATVKAWDNCSSTLSTIQSFTVAAAATTTVAISANPTTVTKGSGSVLSVSASNASSVSVAGSDGSSYTVPNAGGTVNVTPTATTTYTATANGSSGTVTATTTVTVTVPSATVSVSANPTSVTAGDASQLTVTAANATAVTLTGTDGSSTTLPVTGGTVTVKPTATTTYTATATGNAGRVTATVTVTVNAKAATVSVTANPTSITAGDASQLTVTAGNATAVTLKGNDGSSVTLAATGGTVTVMPTATTIYTATATGSAGNVTATATVTVNAKAATVSVTANPTSIAPGGSSQLTVTATDATAVTLKGNDGSSMTLGATGGTVTVMPTATTIYTATATGSTGSVTGTATVTVTAATTTTVSVSANPSTIAAGASSTLTVTVKNASGVSVTGSDNTSYPVAASGGTVVVSPTTTTVYTVTATGSSNNATATTTVTVSAGAASVTMIARPSTVLSGGSSTLTLTATNATAVTISGSDGSSYTLSSTSGGMQVVKPGSTTTYTATASGSAGDATTTAQVSVNSADGLQSVNHVIFMLQENHSFDNYFGMLNPYRAAHGMNQGADGKTYNVDGIDDKLTKISNTSDEGTPYSPFRFTSTCVEDMTSSWLESYGDVSRYNFTPQRKVVLDGFVHTAENFAKYCTGNSACSGTFTDLNGKRAMGYYDEGFLNYYYYMASQFAVSDRWFSPISSKSKPNRIATFTGGTTQGLVFDPGQDDHVGQQSTVSIFQSLDQAGVPWKIYYTVTQGACLDPDDCSGNASAQYPASTVGYLNWTNRYVYENVGGPACTGSTKPSSVVGDKTNSFCIDPTRIAPLSVYYSDVANGTLPAFAFIEAGYGRNDEHPGSGQSVLAGQQEVATVVNAFMASPSWKDSVFFLSYDEGGGPYDHVPPVPGHSNDYTSSTVGDAGVASIPDIATIAVNPDNYLPCVPSGGTPMLHCDLVSADPGAHPADAATQSGFAAQLGFRVPNMIISPFTRQHYVSHIPMDHTAVLKFVENRFIDTNANLTARDAAQPTLLDFFDFSGAPWATPPTPPAPVTPTSLGKDPCTPSTFAP